MENINKSKIGWVEIYDCMLKQIWTNNKVLIPIEIDVRKHRDSTRYLCYCELFEELLEGAEIPTYKLIYNFSICGSIYINEIIMG